MDTLENPEYDEILASVVRKEAHTPPALQGVVFAVTTIARSERFGGTRTPAVCMSFERAREIVETNEGDIWECSYMLCVIEAVIPDQLYGTNGDYQYWYFWDMKEHRYVPIETPERYQNMFGFGIG
jgi:hypothetical protein